MKFFKVLPKGKQNLKCVCVKDKSFNSPEVFNIIKKRLQHR